MNRVSNSLRISLLCILVAVSVHAQDTRYAPVWEQIPGPPCAGIPQWNSPGPPGTCSDFELNEWLRDITHWRMEHRIRVGYDDALYREPALLWTQSSFVQPQMMVHDRMFY